MPIDLNLSNQRAIVDSQGRPLVWFALEMRQNARSNAALVNISGSSDNIAQGITNKIRAIAKEEIAYNASGAITGITVKDATTDAVIETEVVTYNGASQVESIAAADAVSTVDYSIAYDANALIESITPEIEAVGF